MSDVEEESDGEQLYSCSKCPNQTFTAAEKDSHRRMHNEAKIRGGRRSHRAPSPTNTDVTLFQPLPETPDGSIAGTPPTKKKGKKRRTRKKFDRGVVRTLNDGG